MSSFVVSVVKPHRATCPERNPVLFQAPTAPFACENDTSRVDIGITPIRTLPASKTTAHTIARRSMPALRTLLRRVPGIDADHPASSMFGFLADQRPQYSKPGVEQRTVQPALRLHVPPRPFGTPLGRPGHVLQLEVFQ